MAGLFVLVALSMVGVPPLPGFWAKFLLLSGLAAEGTSLAYLAMFIVLLMTVVEAHYLFRVITLLYGKPQEKPVSSIHRPVDIISASLLGLLLLFATLFIQPVGLVLGDIAEQVVNVSAYIERVLPEARLSLPGGGA
jgi:formate hydrogenlyase subunit 3/multisubunit Na+/H+ antiporter MnhD subunit